MMRVRSVSTVVLACIGLLIATTGVTAASPWARHPAVEVAGDCAADPVRPLPLGPLMGPWSGRTPPVKVGVWRVLIDPEEPAGRRHSVALLATGDPDSAVIGCIDVPPDWDRSEAIEVEVQPKAVPTLAGRARLTPVDDVRTEIVLVSWSSAGLAPTSDVVVCDRIGKPRALLTDLAELGMADHWRLVTPDGTPVWVAWSEGGEMTAAIVGDAPVRSLAIQALYDADSTQRGGWSGKTLAGGFAMLEALSDRWDPSDDPRQWRWPTTAISETPRIVMTQDVEIDDQGLFIGFQVEPRAVARTCGN